MKSTKPIRVLIADDSGVSRRVLADLVHGAEDIAVVASVADGEAAVAEAARVRPDVVLMDVLMPVMDGLSATRSLMQETPCPIILVSELVGRDADLNFRALEAGALDLMRKPSREEVAEGVARSVLLRKIRTYSKVPVVRRHRPRKQPAAKPASPAPAPAPPPPAASSSAGQARTLVCIGASTGGPPAIRALLEALDATVQPPILITQHMTEGFMRGMASWLDDQVRQLDVSVAVDGDRPCPGHVYLAPDNAHLELVNGLLRLSPELPQMSHRPSVNALFASVARSRSARDCMAILLTGMGRDGADGMLALRRAGALTVAQDEASSTVYGMPQAARQLGAASEELALDKMAGRIRKFVQQRANGEAT
jgi:two-component system chemotaxis response regulator CheB